MLIPPGLLLFGFQGSNHSPGMLVRFQTIDDGGDPAFRADHKRRPLNPHIFLAIHALLFHHAVLIAYGLVHIRQQRIRQVVFFLEFLLGRRLVGRNPQHYGAGFLDLCECVAEPARLNRSTGRVGLGEEEQNYIFSAIVFQ